MQEYYYEIHITSDKFLPEIESFLMDHFYNGIEEEADTLILRSEEPLDPIIAKLKAYVQSLEELFGEKIALEVVQQKKKNSDWIEKFKRSITAVEVGDFYIYPSWEQPKTDKISIKIDPALAFGSGHHETTRGCLQALQKYVTKGDEVLDVGTGSGILAIGAAKLGAVVDLCDTDELAVSEAKKNFALNGAEFRDIWIGSAVNAKRKYDIVIANIVADVLMMIARDLKKATKEGGIIILSGIIDKYRDKVYEKFQLPLLEEFKEGEWVTMILQKRGVNE